MNRPVFFYIHEGECAVALDSIESVGVGEHMIDPISKRRVRVLWVRTKTGQTMYDENKSMADWHKFQDGLIDRSTR